MFEKSTYFDLLKTVDRRMYILNVLARYPGSTSDSFIFEGSALRRRMIQIQENQRRRCYLLGMFCCLTISQIVA